ncbi:M48 family metalloprotease [Candidatus Absconditicoccus praedator]|uniref:M48 family metalloprotease n=1 Tax=Candidatus Absconditicoccus praedator TaxID=2735562 RepID=UPI001E52CD51|nr:M48 family metalloprotease [Candidatus Absconditicoccus praedator]UFX82736.1 M48 family metalloprotease [Candidatus Absconditicoccus praedator]
MNKKVELPINTPKEATPTNPDWGWGLKMILLTLGFLGLAFGSFYAFSYLIVKNISLEQEKEIFGDFMMMQGEYQEFDKSIVNGYLDDFEYDLYLWEADQANAFATLGANIAVSRGLLEEVEYLEELLFVIGHEKGHVVNQDPLRMFTTQFPFMMALRYFGYDIGVDLTRIGNLMGNFVTKEMEIQADNKGIEFVKDKGLDPACALGFFDEESGYYQKMQEFFSTHPMTSTRIENIKKQIGIEEFDFQDCKDFPY